MTLYIGVDFHPHRQTIAWCDTETGETDIVEMLHDIEQVRKFYASLPEPAIIGIEASVKAAWFENIVSQIGWSPTLGREGGLFIAVGRSAGPSRSSAATRQAAAAGDLLRTR